MASQSSKIKESDIQSAICEYLEMKRRCFFRLNNIPAVYSTGGKMRFRKLPKFTPRGLPDFVVIVAGTFYGLEVKRPKTEDSPKTYQSKDQKSFQSQVEAHGGKYVVVRSIEDVIALGL